MHVDIRLYSHRAVHGYHLGDFAGGLYSGCSGPGGMEDIASWSVPISSRSGNSRRIELLFARW